MRGRRLHDLDAALRELAARGLDVVAGERTVEERADAIFMAFGREQHDARRRMRDAQLDPALAWAHRLIGRDREAELLGVELERALLVGSCLLVLATELMNSAIEAVIERYGPEHHELAGRAKDMGSAAVLLLMFNVVLCWTLILWQRLA